MKKTALLKSRNLFGLPEIFAVFFMTASFIGGTYVEQGLLALPDRVNFRQSLPWFVVFTLAIMYFNNAFDLSRRIHQIAFSMFSSIVMINLLMMALPFFDVLYYVQITTLSIIVAFECLSMGIWIQLFHNLWLKANPPLSTAVICDDYERGKEIGSKINRHSHTNRIDEVLSYGSNSLFSALSRFDSIILVQPPAELKNEIALKCWEEQKELIIVPDIFELIVNNASLVQFDDLMAYKAKSMGLSPNQRFLKRVFDIVFSSLALVLLSPVMLVIAIIVRRDGGKAIFSQKRVTQGGRIFKLYKFRTMIPDAEKYTGPTLAAKDDPRITKCGRWLRQSRLDEIPQFWNVLIGDMSLVGPRPEREHFINIYMETLPEYQYRTKVRAGITGLAHVLGKYNTAPEERIKLDLTYIQNYSFFLDIKIIIETVRIVFTKEYAEGVDIKQPAGAKHSPEAEPISAARGAPEPQSRQNRR